MAFIKTQCHAVAALPCQHVYLTRLTAACLQVSFGAACHHTAHVRTPRACLAAALYQFLWSLGSR